jgi:hypothetical protein
MVVVLGHELWRRELRGDPDVVGRILSLPRLASSLVAALVPALVASKANLAHHLRRGGTVAGSRGRRLTLRSAVVVAQCAASMVLLSGALLFVRSLDHASRLDLGVRHDGIAVATRTLDAERFTPAAGRASLRDLLSRLESHPEVESAAVARSLELTLFQPLAPVRVRAGEREADQLHRNAVSPGYLELRGVPMISGRTIDAGDGITAPLVAVVNQSFAERFWPGSDALGQHFEVRERNAARDEAPRTYTVIGLAQDGKYVDYDDPPMPYFWTAFDQDYGKEVAVVVKGRQAATPLVRLLSQEVSTQAGEAQRIAPATLESQVAVQFAHLRAASRVLGGGGSLALLLSVVGIYGIVAG